jgi:hypothetical protein
MFKTASVVIREQIGDHLRPSRTTILDFPQVLSHVRTLVIRRALRNTGTESDPTGVSAKDLEACRQQDVDALRPHTELMTQLQSVR